MGVICGQDKEGDFLDGIDPPRAGQGRVHRTGRGGESRCLPGLQIVN